MLGIERRPTSRLGTDQAPVQRRAHCTAARAKCPLDVKWSGSDADSGRSAVGSDALRENVGANTFCINGNQ